MENSDGHLFKSFFINGKEFNIIHKPNGNGLNPPPKKRKHDDSFRRLVEDGMVFGDQVQLNEEEMHRAKRQLLNVKTKAKKAGQQLDYKPSFRTEIKGKLYLLSKLAACLGVLGYIVYDQYEDRIVDKNNSANIRRSVHPPACLCLDCSSKPY